MSGILGNKLKTKFRPLGFRKPTKSKFVFVISPTALKNAELLDKQGLQTSFDLAATDPTAKKTRTTPRKNKWTVTAKASSSASQQLKGLQVLSEVGSNMAEFPKRQVNILPSPVRVRPKENTRQEHLNDQGIISTGVVQLNSAAVVLESVPVSSSKQDKMSSSKKLGLGSREIADKMATRLESVGDVQVSENASIGDSRFHERNIVNKASEEATMFKLSDGAKYSKSSIKVMRTARKSLYFRSPTKLVFPSLTDKFVHETSTKNCESHLENIKDVQVNLIPLTQEEIQINALGEIPASETPMEVLALPMFPEVESKLKQSVCNIRVQSKEGISMCSDIAVLVEKLVLPISFSNVYPERQTSPNRNSPERPGSLVAITSVPTREKSKDSSDSESFHSPESDSANESLDESDSELIHELNLKHKLPVRKIKQNETSSLDKRSLGGNSSKIVSEDISPPKTSTENVSILSPTKISMRENSPQNSVLQENTLLGKASPTKLSPWKPSLRKPSPRKLSLKRPSPKILSQNKFPLKTVLRNSEQSFPTAEKQIPSAFSRQEDESHAELSESASESEDNFPNKRLHIQTKGVLFPIPEKDTPIMLNISTYNRKSGFQSLEKSQDNTPKNSKAHTVVVEGKTPPTRTSPDKLSTPRMKSNLTASLRSEINSLQKVKIPLRDLSSVIAASVEKALDNSQKMEHDLQINKLQSPENMENAQPLQDSSDQNTREQLENISRIYTTRRSSIVTGGNLVSTPKPLTSGHSNPNRKLSMFFSTVPSNESPKEIEQSISLNQTVINVKSKAIPNEVFANSNDKIASKFPKITIEGKAIRSKVATDNQTLLSDVQEPYHEPAKNLSQQTHIATATKETEKKRKRTTDVFITPQSESKKSRLFKRKTVSPKDDIFNLSRSETVTKEGRIPNRHRVSQNDNDIDKNYASTNVRMISRQTAQKDVASSFKAIPLFKSVSLKDDIFKSSQTGTKEGHVYKRRRVSQNDNDIDENDASKNLKTTSRQEAQNDVASTSRGTSPYHECEPVSKELSVYPEPDNDSGLVDPEIETEYNSEEICWSDSGYEQELESLRKNLKISSKSTWFWPVVPVPEVEIKFEKQVKKKKQKQTSPKVRYWNGREEGPHRNGRALDLDVFATLLIDTLKEIKEAYDLDKGDLMFLQQFHDEVEGELFVDIERVEDYITKDKHIRKLELKLDKLRKKHFESSY